MDTRPSRRRKVAKARTCVCAFATSDGLEKGRVVRRVNTDANRVSRIASGRTTSLGLAGRRSRASVLCREIDYTLDNAGFTPEERYVSGGACARVTQKLLPRLFPQLSRWVLSTIFFFIRRCRRYRYRNRCGFHSALITIDPLTRILVIASPAVIPICHFYANAWDTLRETRIRIFHARVTLQSFFQLSENDSSDSHR